MKGYFSQLARSTGLSLQPHKTTATDGVSQPISAHEQDAVSPLEVEDAIVVAPAVGLNISDGAFEASADVSGEGRAEDSSSPEEIELTKREAGSSTGKLGQRLLESSLKVEKPDTLRSEPEKQAQAISPAVFDTPLPELAGAEERVRITERVDSHQLMLADAASGASQQAGEEGVALNSVAQTVDVTNPNRDETLRAYLREVQEWIAAPPVESEDEGNAFSNRSESSDWNEPESIIALDTQGRAAAHEVEAQDFHLSIGTISVVIEDPQPQAATQTMQSPPQNQGKTVARAADETSRFGRHYISVR